MISRFVSYLSSLPPEKRHEAFGYVLLGAAVLCIVIGGGIFGLNALLK